MRFKLKTAWPDFLTFYASATGAGWVVPKAYVEKVGEEGVKKAPIGAGPYKFVSFNPGVELVLEAFEGYWRKTPSVKRLVLRVIPEEATRLAALKRGEVDIAYSLQGEIAEELQRTPNLKLKAPIVNGTFWLYFPDQWDAKSPWHDVRVRQAAHAGDRYKTHQSGAGAGLGPQHRQHRARELRLLLETTSAGLRPGQGEETAGRGWLPHCHSPAITNAHCGRNRSARLCRRSAPEADDRPSSEARPARHQPPSPTIEKLLVMLTMQTAGVAQTGYPKVAL